MLSKARKNSDRSWRNCRPEEAVGQAEGDGAGAGRHLQRQPAGHEVGAQEPAQDARVEEVHQPVGGLEEVERVAGGRGVEDHQVPPLVRAQLQELLHRHVLVAAGEGGGDVPVEAVAEDPLAGRGVGRVAGDEGVERALHVEHHGPQRPAARGRGSEARELDRARLARELVEAEARGEAPRGVDGADEHAAAGAGRAQGERRRRRRLADAAGAAGHQDALRGERPLERRGGRGAGGIRRPRASGRAAARPRAPAPRGRGRAARRAACPGCAAAGPGRSG